MSSCTQVVDRIQTVLRCPHLPSGGGDNKRRLGHRPKDCLTQARAPYPYRQVGDDMSEDMGFSSRPARQDHCQCPRFPGWHFETAACRSRRRLDEWNRSRG